MLYGDLLLASAPVVVEPFSQRDDRSCSLRYIASDASFAIINCAISIPSIGSAGAISIAP